MRALVKYLDAIPDEVITELNIPTGIPLVYELDERLRAVNHYYLGDQDAVARPPPRWPVSCRGRSRCRRELPWQSGR